MLSDADAPERAVLGAIGYSPNTVYLHRDPRLMPKRRRAWASWNFLRWQREGSAQNDVAVTYWMNPLQGIDEDKPLFVSLNPPFAPAPELAFGKYMCEHPQYNAAAFAAQKKLGDIQGRRHTWFCGALDRLWFPRGRIALGTWRLPRRLAPVCRGEARRPNSRKPRNSHARTCRQTAETPTRQTQPRFILAK